MNWHLIHDCCTQIYSDIQLLAKCTNHANISTTKYVMKRKFEQRWSTIPPISTKRTIQHYVCDKVCHWPPTGQWFSPISSTNKTDRHNITEILLKVVLNTIKPKQNQRPYLTSNYYWTSKRPRHMALEILLYFHRLLI
jgi:hypothetical protein